MTWTTTPTLEGLNGPALLNMPAHLGIEFTAFGDDWLTARMPVNERTKQPFGLLHGGASAALAETLGSVASVLCIDDLSKQQPVGVDLNCTHLKSTTKGFVYGTVRAARVGRRLHVWDIRIQDDAGNDICISRLTVMVVERR